MGLRFFLSAYDPSSLPGRSIDPLGFDRGYGALVDLILPGITNQTNHPRYLEVLCLGSYLCGELSADSPMKTRYRREQSILKLERCWALANVIAADDEEISAPSGLRGVTYVRAYWDTLKKNAIKKTDLDYKLLSRQSQYGVIGAYGRVAEGMQLINRKTFALYETGKQLSEVFWKESQGPTSIRDVIAGSKNDVSISDLKEWGKRTHILGQYHKQEMQCFRNLIHLNSARSRFCHLLSQHPFREGEPELQRLRRIENALRYDSEGNQDLLESVSAILWFEKCYSLVMLAFERILWLCRQNSTGSINMSEIEDDDAINRSTTQISSVVSNLIDHLDSATTERFKDIQKSLMDIRVFLETAAEASQRDGSKALCRNILSHHRKVQRSKFDRGLSKAPWVEEQNDSIYLTNITGGGLDFEAFSEDQILAHPYRISAADHWLKAAGEA